LRVSKNSYFPRRGLSFLPFCSLSRKAGERQKDLVHPVNPV
jgi:hypothetical protein